MSSSTRFTQRDNPEYNLSRSYKPLDQSSSDRNKDHHSSRIQNDSSSIKKSNRYYEPNLYDNDQRKQLFSNQQRENGLSNNNRTRSRSRSYDNKRKYFKTIQK